MEITLNHTIVPVKDHVSSAEFYQRIFGFEFVKVWGSFAVVKVNSTLTLDFAIREKFSPIHYAFKVSEKQFDEIFNRVKAEGIVFGSKPGARDDGKINHNDGGRGVYFDDPDGHILEIITRDYNID